MIDKALRWFGEAVIIGLTTAVAFYGWLWWDWRRHRGRPIRFSYW